MSELADDGHMWKPKNTIVRTVFAEVLQSVCGLTLPDLSAQRTRQAAPQQPSGAGPRTDVATTKRMPAAPSLQPSDKSRAAMRDPAIAAKRARLAASRDQAGTQQGSAACSSMPAEDMLRPSGSARPVTALQPSPTRSVAAAHGKPASFAKQAAQSTANRRSAVVTDRRTQIRAPQPTLIPKRSVGSPDRTACQDGKKRRLAPSVSIDAAQNQTAQRLPLSPLSQVQRGLSGLPWQLQYGENVPPGGAR
jgi:hypothetical protein